MDLSEYLIGIILNKFLAPRFGYGSACYANLNSIWIYSALFLHLNVIIFQIYIKLGCKVTFWAITVAQAKISAPRRDRA